MFDVWEQVEHHLFNFLYSKKSLLCWLELEDVASGALEVDHRRDLFVDDSAIFLLGVSLRGLEQFVALGAPLFLLDFFRVEL